MLKKSAQSPCPSMHAAILAIISELRRWAKFINHVDGAGVRVEETLLASNCALE